MTDAAGLKAALPLPELMARLGDGAHAKKSARCPFHEDGSNSFSVFKHDGGDFWKCFAGCGEGDELSYLEKRLGLSTAEAFTKYRELAGVNGHGGHKPVAKSSPEPKRNDPLKPEADLSEHWRKCVAAFTEQHRKRLVQWRGLSTDFVDYLVKRELVGLSDGKLALPVHNENGQVVTIHHRIPPPKDGGKTKWFFEPDGVAVRPLVIGDTKAADVVLAFESQFDAFAVLDKLAFHKGALPDVAVFVTRGAANAKLVRGLRTGACVYAFAQNDEAGLKWLQELADTAGAKVRHVATPEPHKDANDWTRAGAGLLELDAAMETATEVKPSIPPKADAELSATIQATTSKSEQPKATARPVFVFRKPSEWRDYIPPEGMVLAGDNHIVRGNVVVIGGEPGCGKSRATVALAQAGAICADWFGLKVHRKFKTLILQNENGGLRLKDEFSELDCALLDEFCRVCDPPEYGMRFDAEDFCAALKTELEAFQPDVVVIDPWNSVAMDDKQKDYLRAFREIRAVIPAGETSPVLVIVAHTRKPKKGERRPTGRELLHELAGSYGLGSVPRTVFIMQHATADTEDNRIVWTCAKANDARQLGGRSAWLRCNGLFQPVQDFDWKEFDTPAADRVAISAEDVAEVFANGRQLARKVAVEELAEQTGCKVSACYGALKKFAKHLREREGMLQWKA